MTSNDIEKFSITSRAVEGDIQDTSKPQYEQWTAEQFLSVVDDILAVPGVDSIRWRQYTPYFNDGEPCEFSVHDVQVKLVDGDPEGGDYEDGYEDSWTLSYRAEREGVTLPTGLEDALKKWQSAHFESVARKNFGDHAIVTATRGGFSVEFYDHD